MAPGEANALEYDWRYRARPEQLPPAGSWRVWLLLAGRGFGKTRCGAEWVRAEVKAGRRRIALVGPTAADARNVMVEGASGIRALLDDPTTIITRGTSYDNATNLAPAFLAQIVKRYEGTRLGRQELNAEVLEDVPGALWNRKRLEELRWPHFKAVPELVRIVVAIDPAASSSEESDETGI